jgi:hypothetical protein
VIPRAPAFAEASQRGLPLAFLGGSLATEAQRFDLLAAEIEPLLKPPALPPELPPPSPPAFPVG